MSAVDVLQGAQDAVFAALKPLEGDTALPTGLMVLVDVPAIDPGATLPPMVMVGEMKSDDASAKGDQIEEVSVEVCFAYRGKQRYRMMAMMHAARVALVGQEISLAGSGVLLEYPRFISAIAGKAMDDGVTYLGILNVQFMGWPG